MLNLRCIVVTLSGTLLYEWIGNPRNQAEFDNAIIENNKLSIYVTAI